jgi:hypothetical protein
MENDNELRSVDVIMLSVIVLAFWISVIVLAILF